LPCSFCLALPEDKRYNFGVTLNGFCKKPLPEPKKPVTCGDCRQYNRFQRVCKLDGHTTSPNTPVCKQATAKAEPRRAF
jgi:hypothetical protein